MKLWDDTSIPVRLRNILATEGIESIDALAALTRVQFQRKKNVGPVAVAAAVDLLAANGRAFAGELIDEHHRSQRLSQRTREGMVELLRAELGAELAADLVAVVDAAHGVYMKRVAVRLARARREHRAMWRKAVE